MIYIEIAELVGNPVRTGIQRVVREIIRRRAAIGEVTLCYFDRVHGYPRTLPGAAVELLSETDPQTGAMAPKDVAQKVQDIISSSATQLVQDPRVPMLVPEVFFDPVRCGYYEWRKDQAGSETFFISYDFIPWLHPDHIGVIAAGPLMHYLRLLRDSRNVSFISAHTRDDYASRIVRRTSEIGPVIPLGADGLQIERQSFRPDRRDFLCVGSIDGRKNQEIVLRAFRELWRTGFDMTLTFAGRVFDPTSPIALEIAEARKSEPLFRHLDAPSDEEMKGLLRQARATIYASEIEGFGLPPLEGLHAGIPAIVGQALPSMAEMPVQGFVRLAAVTPANIQTAVKALASDAAAAALWADAAKLVTPTWDDTAAFARNWMRGRSN